uniref:glucose-6-phosphate 1-epimerase n=2 Tax=Brassica campestris TaxID=3711 RepID=A0A3P6AA74_BRACM|nr:unnamed protein product [Brassica rapa]
MPLNFGNDVDGSSRILLNEPRGSTAQVLLFGGQVISWKNERREELLFMSSKAQYSPPKIIRGGIPVCFPQFGNFGGLERHGFARNRFWSLDEDPSPLPPANKQSSVDLILKSTEDDLKIWPHSFELRVRISISLGKLTVIPRVRNIDSKPFSFMFALRNYLHVSDISEVRVEGLETLDYLDNLKGKERFTEQADAITFDGEIDRVYLNTPTKIAVIDHERKRTIELRKEGMPNAAVVWNPWDKKAKSIADMGDEDYMTMLCVDSGAIEPQVLLKPGEEWKGRQELSIVSSSYCSGQLDPRKLDSRSSRVLRCKHRNNKNPRHLRLVSCVHEKLSSKRSAAWIVDGPGIASKVKNASLSSALQTRDCGASIQCPNCYHRIDNTNVLVPWPGLPKGVKFEPTDADIIEFLEAKCGIGGSEPHVLIEEFIRPVTEDVGINYTHPKNLPGTNKDGVSAFFVHKTVQAYGTGQRKRRKITPTSLNEEPVRWHKTGRNKHVFLNGVKRGCKKIMVLYKSARKGSKPEKSKWVLHQYHLGTEGNEIGEYVVSKVTYQKEKVKDEGESSGVRGGPTTPMTNTPTPPRPVDGEAFDDDKMFDPFYEGLDSIPEAALWSKKARREEEVGVNLSEDNLTCNESIEASSPWENNQILPNPSLGELDGFALSDLENVDLGTPPDFLTLASQDSLMNWMGWL